MADARLCAVVVTYDALPWIEQCLASLDGIDTVVVDHGSADGTTELVGERFPSVRLIRQANLGLAAGWNRGLAETTAQLVLVVNADAWLAEGAAGELAACADRHVRAAIVAPQLRNLDGSLQRSVRGFPTLWRVATEYLFLRKLAPSSRMFNAYYGNGFAHDVERTVDWAMGACFLLRRDAYAEVGPFDEDFFLFCEETDWAWRAATQGWNVVFTPTARCTHIGGAAHGGRQFHENLRSLVRFFVKHHGRATGERARRLLCRSLALRSLVLRGPRGQGYRTAARWLENTSLDALLERRR
jgi:GT2 family glycosyltransferase